jgi:hypothetical protein
MENVDDSSNSIATPENMNSRFVERGELTPEKFLLGDNIGPMTRRKENQIHQLSSIKLTESFAADIRSLKNFDDYYKDSKNLENEVYHYHPPRLSMSYQVDLTLIDKFLNHHPGAEKLYDLTKISNDDLNYYLKFVNYYKTSLEGNCLLKGISNFEVTALDLLKDCNYDINLSLRRILFPCLDIPELSFNRDDLDPFVYVNSALNDLIGSNIQEKQQWLEHVRERIEEGIDILELQELIEIANKMKIDIPDFILEEIEKSLNFAKLVRRHLNEKNSLKDIYSLLAESKKYKVKTEECSLLQDVIVKTQSWIARVKELENTTINYKVLQNIFNEGKNLPISLQQIDDIRVRYQKAHAWQEKYIALPKHSKTRQNNSREERCSMSYLAELIQEADEINFNSHEVTSLKTNYARLREAECRILLSLEDPVKPRTKEMFKEYISILDSLKFTTELYEWIFNNIEYYGWQERKDYYFNNKVLKVKHLRNLVKEATQKGLLAIPEIKSFKQQSEEIETWLEKMTNIFYKEDTDMEDNKTDINEIYTQYETGMAFKLQPEELQHVLEKSEEIFDFVNECKAANSSQTYDFQKLFTLREQINKYNIKCEEFNMVDTQITAVQNWKELYDHICQKKDEVLTQTFEFQELTSLEVRNTVIESIEQFLRCNPIFMESLTEILNKVPQFAKNSKEYIELYNEYINAEKIMTANCPEKMSLEELQVFINSVKNYFIRKSYFAQILCCYRGKSWSYIATLKQKKTLDEAEIMLKEANNLKLDDKEVENLRNEISFTKDWLRKSKRYLGIERVNYNDFKNFLIQGDQLPLHPQELEDFWLFNASLENDIFQAKNIIQNKTTYEELCEFMYKIKGLSVIVSEFELLINLKSLCDNWKAIAEKILASRKMCTLFFQNLKNNNGVFQYIEEECEEKSSSEYSTRKTEEFFKGNLEGTNINIINNNYYFNNNVKPIPSKKKIKKTSKKAYENMLNIINNIPHKKEAIKISPKKKTTDLSKNNIKKFHTYTYEEKLDMLNKTVMLKSENEHEQYCICRRGDDSVNYMIMCENCKEWFHGKCLKLTKAAAEKISQYLCLACTRRKDITSTFYHLEFFNNKRINLERFLLFIREGEDIPITFAEMESLHQYSDKIANWKLKYQATIKEILKFIALHLNVENTKSKFYIADERLEKSLVDLYLESEGFPVEIENFLNMIVILKHQDWLRDALKCVENKKFSEKLNRKVLSQYYTLFTKDNFIISCEEDNIYYNTIFLKANELFTKIAEIYETNLTIVNVYKSKDKEVKEASDSSTQFILEEMKIYNTWVDSLNSSLTTDGMTDELFASFVERAKMFKFKTSFLEKFKLISASFSRDRIDYYRLMLFDENEKKDKIIVNKIKK